MEELNQIEVHSSDSSNPDNEYRQEESADWGFGEDITDLLQLDDVIAEGPVIDESSNQCYKRDMCNEISHTGNTLENKTFESKDSKENKEDFIQTGTQKKKYLKIKIKNNKSRVDEISCNPYIIEEDVDLIDIQKDSKNSKEEEEKLAFMESVRKRKRIKSEKIEDSKEKEIKSCKVKIEKNKDSEERRGIQLMSIEEADKIFKALVDSICEKNDQDVGLQCKSCGFYSENIQERIEHLNGARHAAVIKVRNAIRLGILENYTINTFYCTICSWFITDMSSIIEHILSSRHKDAELISRYTIPGVMLDSFCSNCKCILKYKRSIYNHIASYKNHTINYYSIQLKKHVVLKKHKIRGVYCEICHCYVNIDNIEEHLDNHEEVCYYFNKGDRTNYKKKCFNSGVKECKWPHKCEICKGDHPRIECFLRKEQNKISGAMVDSFCNDCECKLKYNKSIYNHMVAHKYHSVNFYFIQLKKHVVMKMNENKEVYCDICNCYISIDDVERHLDNHDGACYYFNKGLMKNHAAVNGCKWHHKCGICRGDHPWIACSLKKEENIIPILGQEKSKFGLQHENEMIMPNNSYKNSKQNDKVSEPEKNLDGKLIKVDTYDSLLPENADVSKVQKNLTTRYSKHNEDGYESNTCKQLTKSDIQDRISYPDEKYRNVNKSYKRNKLSRSSTIDYSSKNTSNRTNNISISKSDSINGRYPIKEHSPRRQFSQSGNKQEVITNSCLISIDGHSTDIVHSGDEDGEFNLITAIVKLLEICDLLGNLGYFFANTLKNALEKVKSEEDILNILREHANIILMEVILKKIEACKGVYDMEPYIKIKRGIRYLKYLIDLSKSSQLKIT